MTGVTFYRVRMEHAFLRRIQNISSKHGSKVQSLKHLFNMAMENCIAILLGLLSSIIACIELQINILNVHVDYLRKRINIMRMISISKSREVVLKRIINRRGSHALSTHALSYRFFVLRSYLRIHVDRRKRFKQATCGRKSFQKRRKKPSFLKNSGYVWTWPQLSGIFVVFSFLTNGCSHCYKYVNEYKYQHNYRAV